MVQEDLFSLLDRLEVDNVCAPSDLTTWRAEKTLRSKKVTAFNRHQDATKVLWRAVQTVEKAYSGLRELMDQDEYLGSSLGTSLWSLYTCAVPDSNNPFIQIMSAVHMQMRQQEWAEYGCWFFNDANELPAAEVDLIEAQLLLIEGNVGLRFVRFFLRECPQRVAPVSHPEWSAARREAWWATLLALPECCIGDPDFTSKLVKIYPTPGSISSTL